jgi:hypothetical protein
LENLENLEKLKFWKFWKFCGFYVDFIAGESWIGIIDLQAIVSHWENR